MPCIEGILGTLNQRRYKICYWMILNQSLSEQHLQIREVSHASKTSILCMSWLMAMSTLESRPPSLSASTTTSSIKDWEKGDSRLQQWLGLAGFYLLSVFFLIFFKKHCDAVLKKNPGWRVQSVGREGDSVYGGSGTQKKNDDYFRVQKIWVE